MPTAARLVAALAYGLVAFFATESFEPLLPEGSDTRWLSELNALFGAIAGWRGNGREAGKGYGPAVTTALVTTATFVFYALIFHSVYQMIKRALLMQYSDTMEAVVGVFELAGRYGMMMVKSPTVVGVLIIGGILAAWLTEWASSRWR